MSKVTIITYELINEGTPLGLAHEAAITAHTESCWSFVNKYGAVGYRPCKHTAMRSLFFNASVAPAGFRKIGVDKDKIECVPNRKTKAGKDIDREFSEIERPPSGNNLAGHFDWPTGSFVIDGTSIYFPTYMAVKFPTTRHFLRLPRQSDDGWTPPPTLRELLESELMAAVEAHNAEAKCQNGGVP